jgi:hypothetical protein
VIVDAGKCRCDRPQPVVALEKRREHSVESYAESCLDHEVTKARRITKKN